VDELAGREPGRRDVGGMEEDDASVAGDPAIAILESIDGRVELIVAADRRHQELAVAKLFARWRNRGDDGFAGRRLERAALRAARQPEAARLAHAAVEILEAGNDARDRVADAVVVGR